MKKLLPFLCAALLLTACESTPPQEEGMVPAPDAVQVTFFKEGMDNPASNRKLLRRDAAEVSRLANLLKGQSAQEYKCGYTGRIEFLHQYQIVRSVEFNLDKACQHLMWMQGGELRTAVLPEAEAAWLEQLRTSPWSLDELNFMLGAWYQWEADSALTTEEWKQVGDHFEGFSHTLHKGDTVWQERLTLQQRGADFYYVVDGMEQNDNKPVDFKLEFLEGTMAGFSNPAHDWPQRIIYTQVNPDSLFARVEGSAPGKPYRGINFGLKRKK